ncbi:TROPOMYOSIN [Salix purpurea]|uniref:TROPOMYOSIN n=1 Tax=Salix purpurea TaxID=77065 RepID=A0A9Q0WBC1_SALPP|nr:TROPOMYOSIN [Salix purpurea]
MEEYLHHMQTLRSQMNEVEDQAAKISVEEQTQITTIQTLEKDLVSAKSEIKRLKEDTEQMMKARGEICSQILEKQRKSAVLDSDSHTLAQVFQEYHESTTRSNSMKNKRGKKTILFLG